jgi:hypothetical protein
MTPQTKAAKTEKTEVFALVHYKRSDTTRGEGEIRISLVTRDEMDADKYHGIEDYLYSEFIAQFGGLYLHDLELRAWVEVDRNFLGEVKPSKISSYNARLNYHDVWRVDLERAEAMSATLRKIAGRVAKYEAEWGAPTSFVQGALYALKAIGVKQIVRRNTDHAREMSGYDYKVSALTDLAYVIDGLINPPQPRTHSVVESGSTETRAALDAFKIGESGNIAVGETSNVSIDGESESN